MLPSKQQSMGVSQYFPVSSDEAPHFKKLPLVSELNVLLGLVKDPYPAVGKKYIVPWLLSSFMAMCTDLTTS